MSTFYCEMKKDIYLHGKWHLLEKKRSACQIKKENGRGKNGAILAPDKGHSSEMKKAFMRMEKGHLL